MDFNKFGFGVNVMGSFKSEKGLGTAVRADIRSLQAAKIPCACNDSSDSGSSNPDNSLDCFSSNNPYLFNLIHINPHTYVSIDGVSVNYYEYLAKHTEYLRGHYNIGYWVWELDAAPEYWKDVSKYIHEIWTPSDFSMRSISRGMSVPVVRIPHCVYMPGTRPETIKKRNDFNLTDDVFLFLFIFDFSSYIERKNPFGVIDAFKKAFSPSDKAMLFIKTYHTASNRPKFYELLRAIRGYNITVSDAVFPQGDVRSLISVSDCYVSLHRSEGFGLTIAEAMSMGKPVIATGYSGNMDFMNYDNSFPVDYKLKKLEKDYGVYEKGNYWAEPDTDEASCLMKRVFENREEAKNTGNRGMNFIRNYYSPEYVGELYKNRLNKIIKNFE